MINWLVSKTKIYKDLLARHERLRQDFEDVINKRAIHEVHSMLARFEALIACSPFRDRVKPESKKDESTLDKK